MTFWRLVYIGIGLAGVGAIVLALFSATPGGNHATVIATPTVAVPAAPVEPPRRPRFNVN